MGERLVLQITKNNKPVMTAYYHWSGYSSSTMDVLHAFYNAYQDETNTDPLVNAYNALLATGAGPSVDMLHANYAKYPTPANYQPHRNNGLIDVDETAMDNTRIWAEHLAIYDIDTDRFPQVDVFYTSYSAQADSQKEAVDLVLAEISEWHEDLTANDIENRLLGSAHTITKGLYDGTYTFRELDLMYETINAHLNNHPYVYTCNNIGPNNRVEVIAWSFLE